MGLSSFTYDKIVAHTFATGTTDDVVWQSADRAGKTVPVTLKLLPGAKVAPLLDTDELTGEWSRGVPSEAVAFGRFRVEGISTDMHGRMQVTIRQTSMIEREPQRR